MLIPGYSTCSICDELLESGQEITATSGCAFPPEHYLRPHCDAGMHWDCFWSWPLREEFSRGYVEGSIKGYLEAYAAALLYQDDDCVLLIEPAKRAVKPEDCGPSEDPLLHLLLWSWNGHYQIRASGWREWLSQPILCHQETAPLLEAVRARLQRLFPEAEGMLQGIDVPALVAKQQAWVEENFRKPRPRAKGEEGRWERDIPAHNARLDDLCQGHPSCPRCGAAWERLRYLRPARQGQTVVRDLPGLRTLVPLRRLRGRPSGLSLGS